MAISPWNYSKVQAGNGELGIDYRWDEVKEGGNDRKNFNFFFKGSWCILPSLYSFLTIFSQFGEERADLGCRCKVRLEENRLAK